MNNQILENVASRLAEELGIDKAEVTPEKRLVEDLHADSATLIMLVMDLEDEYGITVSDDKLAEIKTIAEVVSLIEAGQA